MAGGKPLGGLVTAIGKNLLGNKFEKYPQPYGKQYQLVQVADDRDEIRNQINWRKSVSNDQNSEYAHPPRRPPVATRKPQSKRIALEAIYPLLDCLPHALGHDRRRIVSVRDRDPGRNRPGLLCNVVHMLYVVDIEGAIAGLYAVMRMGETTAKPNARLPARSY